MGYSIEYISHLHNLHIQGAKKSIETNTVLVSVLEYFNRFSGVIVTTHLGLEIFKLLTLADMLFYSERYNA